MQPGIVEIELTIDGQQAFGSGQVVEYDVAGGTTCRPSAFVDALSVSGIRADGTVFKDRLVGTATDMAEPGLQLEWSDSDPEAGWGEATDIFVGTYEVVTWNDDEVVLALNNGMHCVPGGFNCRPSTGGELAYLGHRVGIIETGRDRSIYSGAVDAVTGRRLCRPN